jgi:hypothetical protein
MAESWESNQVHGESNSRTASIRLPEDSPPMAARNAILEKMTQAAPPTGYGG